jgi:hypothetical protein
MAPNSEANTQQKQALTGMQNNADSQAGFNDISSLGLARVLLVDYEALKVSLKIFKPPVDVQEEVDTAITFPGGGPRGLLGRMPEVGDICVVGWIARQTGSVNQRTPIILAWVAASAENGYGWLNSIDVDPVEEHSPTPKSLSLAGLALGYTRYKLRHQLPGAVFASSSQGSDLILDTDVLLSNRRANEIRLRDADQAFVVRSLQQFHVMGGARIYGGMVQRDFGLLQKDMIHAPTVVDALVTLTEDTDAGDSKIKSVFRRFEQFPAQDSALVGTLNPEPIFSKDANGDYVNPDFIKNFSPTLNPYNFLYNAGIILDKDFGAINPAYSRDSLIDVSSGKIFYRVTQETALTNRDTKKRLNAKNPGLSEYRIEVSHTYDGTLPVTEQTESLDVDRIPDSPLDEDRNTTYRKNGSFVESVYGSVIGNDTSTIDGRESYGLALTPLIFNTWDVTNPSTNLRISTYTRPTESAEEVQAENPNLYLGAQAATLLRVRPKMVPQLSVIETGDSYFSMTKDGRAAFSISGVSGLPSAEGYLRFGLRMQSDGRVAISSRGGFDFRSALVSQNTPGFYVNTQSSGIHLKANGFLNGAIDTSVTDPLDTNPSILLEGTGPIIFRGASVKFETESFRLGGSQTLDLGALNQINLNTAGIVSLSAGVYEVSVVGKHTQNFIGPKMGIPTNGATRETNFYSSPGTGHLSGAVDKTYILSGNQETIIGNGDKTISIKVGDVKNFTGKGTVTNQAGVNSVTIRDGVIATDPGFDVQIKSGTVNLNAITGGMTMKAAQDVLISSKMQAIVQGQGAGVYLGGPLGPYGMPLPSSGSPVLSALDVDPITGKPYSFYNMGAVSIVIGSPKLG